MPNHFLDGGITGISILLYETLGVKYGIEISIILVVLNFPFFFIAYKKVGRTFAVRTAIAVLILAIALHFVPTLYCVSKELDHILVAIFGGFFIGLGIGFVIRGGCVIDGLEVIHHFTNKKLGLSSGEMLLFVNSILFICAMVFISPSVAMYSIITYFTAIKATEYVVDGFEEFIALNIVSSEHEEIKRIIVQDYGKAISVYKGKRGFLPESYDKSEDCDIIVTIVSRLEIYHIQEAIKAQDPNAFVFVQRIKEVKGGLGKHTKKEH